MGVKSSAQGHIDKVAESGCLYSQAIIFQLYSIIFLYLPPYDPFLFWIS